MARLFTDGGTMPDSYWRVARVWIVFGIVATILPLTNLYWTVFKPA